MNRYILFLCVATVSSNYARQKSWTWHYQHLFSAHQMKENALKKELMFTKIDVPLFSQLIFNWNAARPKQGYYSFYVQVRSKKKKAWSIWHKIADWGNAVQRSYESVSDGICRYVYVRLEIDSDDKADGFRIKAVAHNTDLAGIKSFTINISDLSKFAAEFVAAGAFPTVIMQDVPQKSQLVLEHEKNRMMCSPTSCSMLLEYLLRKPIDPLSFAQQAYDHGLKAYGSWPFNMAHAFELAQGNQLCYATRLPSFKILHEKLVQGIPVVVSVRGTITDAPKSYENGHLLVVVGYNAAAHKIICHDPAALSNQETLKEYDTDSFIRAWDRSRRLAYIIMPCAA